MWFDLVFCCPLWVCEACIYSLALPNSSTQGTNNLYTPFTQPGDTSNVFLNFFHTNFGAKHNDEKAHKVSIFRPGLMYYCTTKKCHTKAITGFCVHTICHDLQAAYIVLRCKNVENRSLRLALSMLPTVYLVVVSWKSCSRCTRHLGTKYAAYLISVFQAHRGRSDRPWSIRWIPLLRG